MNTARTPKHRTARVADQKRSLLTAVIAAGAIAVGAMVATAPLANAIPESTIQKECDDANHGTYSTGIDVNGDRQSSCTYTDSSGNLYIDTYTNGTYTGTNGPLVRHSTPVPRPPTLAPQPGGASHPAAPGAAP